MSEHPAVVFLLAAHQKAEETARAATPGPWEPEGDDPTDDEVYTVHDGEHGDLVGYPVAYVRDGMWGRRGQGRTQANMRLIASQADPVAVMRRVGAERQILAEHEPTWPGGEPEFGYHHETAISKETGRTRYIEIRDDEPVTPYWCEGCQMLTPCRTVLLLAEAWGWEASS